MITIETRNSSGASAANDSMSLSASCKRILGRNTFVQVRYVPDVDSTGQAQAFGHVIAEVETEQIAARYHRRQAELLAKNDREW